MVKHLVIFSLVFIVIASSLGLLLSTGDTVSPAAPVHSSAVTDWSGTLIIGPNGSLSTTLAPVVKDGNYYYLTGNITGSIVVQYSGAIIVGNGHNINGTATLSPLDISYANNVEVRDVVLYSEDEPALNILESTHDLIRDISITSLAAGIFDYSTDNQFLNNTIVSDIIDSQFQSIRYGIIAEGSGANISGNTILMPRGGVGIELNTQASYAGNNYINTTGTDAIGITVAQASNRVLSNVVNVSGTDSQGIQLMPGAQSSVISDNSLNVDGLRSLGVSVDDGLNSISNNTMQVKGQYSYGIYIGQSGTANNQVYDNSIFLLGPDSIGINDISYDTIIEGNSVNVSGSGTRGISALNSIQIHSNTIYIAGDSAIGIYSQNGKVENNDVTLVGDYNYGLYCDYGSYALIEGNTINTAGDHVFGAQLGGTYATFSGNALRAGTQNGTALYVSVLNNGVIEGNNLSGASVGYQSVSTSSSSNTFAGNYLYNDVIAFNISGYQNNRYYHNDFVNFASFVISPFVENSTWDNGYPTGGNYWSSFVSQDQYSGPNQNVSGSDGIADSGYSLTSTSIDHYPLMYQWKAPQAIFIENGLAAGTLWGVTFNGMTLNSNSDKIAFNITEAAFSTYGYSIPEVAGYNRAVITGGVHYIGSTVTVPVQFTSVLPPPPPLYNINFVETGLPSGTSWAVMLNGTSRTSSDTTITFAQPNGTYPYTIEPVNGYAPSVHSGSLTVSGSNRTVNVEFSQNLYQVEFMTDGLPSGITWYLNLSNGKSFDSAGSTLIIYLANGTYRYSAGNVSGYNVTSGNGQFTVAGNSTEPIKIDFAPVNKTVSPPGGGFNFLPYIIGGAIGATVGITAIYVIFRGRK